MRKRLWRYWITPRSDNFRKTPPHRFETRVNTLKKLLQRGEIDKETHSLLRVPADGSRSPLFYELVNLHKPENPIRPIVSAVGSATYQLAKFVSKWLRCYAQKAPSYLLNTKDFIKKLEDVHIGEEEVMVSFDVNILFTSVPVQAAISTIEQALSGDKDFEEREGHGNASSLFVINML